jgi:ankyrin repeat protein
VSGWDKYKATYRTDTDIFDCVRLGDFQTLVNLLSQHPELDLDQKNHRGYSALMLAVYNGQKDCAEALLRCGADVNSCDSMNNTVLMGAAFKGNIEVIELLIQFGADIFRKNKSYMDARDWALMFGRQAALEYLTSLSPEANQASKLKSIFKFISLSLMMLKAKLKLNG